MTTPTVKDLSKEAPRSPATRLGDYVILARAIDKGRASNAGEYHFDCPLDNMLFGFKGVKGEEVKALLQAGASDAEVVAWLNEHGTPKTPEEIKQWSDGMVALNPYNVPDKREWFSEQCTKLNLDPAKTTLFGWLEADDAANVSFQVNKAQRAGWELHEACNSQFQWVRGHAG